MGIKSQGTVVGISNENADTTAYASATFATIGKIKSISDPDGEAAEIDETTLESTEKEFSMGIPDNGKFTLTGIAQTTDAGHTVCRTARAAQEKRWIKITRSDGKVYSFKAVVLRFSDLAMEPDGVVPFNGNFRISGAVTRV